MATPTMLSLDTIGEMCYQDQLMQGDMLKPSFVRAEMIEFDVTEIRKLRNELTTDEELQFRGSYGKLSTLIDVKVDLSCIRAALKFWDPCYRCFSFDKEIDLTPTLEEYAALLYLSPSISCIYQNVLVESASVKLRMDMLVGISSHLKSKKYVWCWSDIAKHFHLSQGEKRLKILAFAIIGLILFPKIKDCVDFEAGNVFYEMERNGINPTTAILAETFRSLDFCRQTGKGKLACCTQLLTVWLISHFKQRPDQSLFFPSYIGMNPLEKVINGSGQEIVVDKWKKEDKETWVDRFLNLSEEDVNQHAKWLRSVNPIVSCGYLRWVPLIGARGCVPYCPALVLRQFSIIQVIPATFGMPSLSLLHSVEIETLRQYANEWRTPFCLEGHIVPTKPTKEYLEWRSNRINGNILPLSERRKAIEEEGGCHAGEGVSYVAHAQLMEQLRIAKEEHDQVVIERDNLLTEKMDLELRVRGLKRVHKESVQMNLASQRIANRDFNKRVNEVIHKRRVSSALLLDKESENQALRVRVAALEVEVKMQKKKTALTEQIKENSTSSRISRC